MAKMVAVILLAGPVPTVWLIAANHGFGAADSLLGTTLLAFAAVTVLVAIIVGVSPAAWLGEGDGIRKRICIGLAWFVALYTVIGAALTMQGP